MSYMDRDWEYQLLLWHIMVSCYSDFSPNPGFMFQLHLFEAMGNKLDQSNSLYKQYQLQAIAKKVQENGKHSCKMAVIDVICLLSLTQLFGASFQGPEAE